MYFEEFADKMLPKNKVIYAVKFPKDILELEILLQKLIDGGYFNKRNIGVKLKFTDELEWTEIRLDDSLVVKPGEYLYRTESSYGFKVGFFGDYEKVN